MNQMQEDGLFAALRKFAQNIKERRRADVVMDGVATGVHTSYFPGDIMEVEGLPELPPILIFEPEAVKALLQGQLRQLTEEAAKSFNIYRFFDPRTVMSGLILPPQYNEETYGFEARVDLGKARESQGFALDEELIQWLEKYERLVQPVEFILVDDDIRQMTLPELPPSQQKITLNFSTQTRG